MEHRMSQDHRLQSQRFELKYSVREGVAQMIRSFVSAYLEMDEFGNGHPQNAYPVHSLYLDSGALALYWHTINGNKNRHKLRIRFYDDDPGSPVFLEIKRRVNNAILKQRCAVRREALDDVLAGRLPARRLMLSEDGKPLVAVQNFSSLLRSYAAGPMAQVSYSREAWISRHDNSIRVTIDRAVRCAPEPCARLAPAHDASPEVFGKQAIVELKFTDRFPDWFAEMVRLFGLQQQSASKYTDGITLLGTERFTPRLGSMTWIPKPASESV